MTFSASTDWNQRHAVGGDSAAKHQPSVLWGSRRCNEPGARFSWGPRGPRPSDEGRAWQRDGARAAELARKWGNGACHCCQEEKLIPARFFCLTFIRRKQRSSICLLLLYIHAEAAADDQRRASWGFRSAGPNTTVRIRIRKADQHTGRYEGLDCNLRCVISMLMSAGIYLFILQSSFRLWS